MDEEVFGVGVSELLIFCEVFVYLGVCFGNGMDKFGVIWVSLGDNEFMGF